ncbi:TniQ family protein [Piscinibacter sp. HJYY11]|uniref:TniQ family protein n=1 Tax=Piscinibacter sp. HJYY11 TaxID=2801333 RepID=UPI00191CCC59|nr:TniQ family protein [Piscinibacter sp. HJYY11]MBL0729441.1 TniQ family protein [Piscinibacter sp. HJYY11]
MGVTAFHEDQLSLWPIRPRPLPDELLSSWMVRLAHANGKKVQRFYRHWFGRDSLPLWNRDIDRLAPPELSQELARRTGVPLELLEETALRSLVGAVFTELATGGLTTWLTTLGVFHRQRRRGGLMCCTTCLADDETPYFRKAWRMSWVTGCTRHRTMLIDRCLCGATLQPHRVDMRERNWLSDQVSMATCWCCGEDLRKLRPGKADPDVLALQRMLETARRDGHVDVAGRSGLHSVLFFNGLRVLLLASARLPGPDGVEPAGAGRFDEMPVEQRAMLLSRVQRLLADWPKTFHSTFSSRPNIYSHFTRHSPVRPFWVDEEVSLLNRSKTDLTSDEARSIESVVEAYHGRFSHALAHEMFGRDLSRLRARERPRITQDDADMFLAGIDIAASTSVGRVREELIRDRTMFLTARLLKLPQSALREMKVEDYLSEIDDEPLDDTPRDGDDLKIYLRRYVRLDRAKHRLADLSPWLFLCSSPTGQMSKSLVGKRYNDALKLAYMDRRIPAFQDWITWPAGEAPDSAPFRLNPWVDCK